MTIYTKTGDDGTTGLQGGTRVSKTSQRIIAYGAVDEINSSLGVILSNKLDEDIKKLLTQIQNELFVVGSDLSNPNLSKIENRITEKMIKNMEESIDYFEKEVTPITKFILPGGHYIASLLHVARTITRRAETQVIALAEKEKINDECKIYLNRLSDLLFVVARVINKRNGVSDIFWQP